jgi:arginine N-succinyltransferase
MHIIRNIREKDLDSLENLSSRPNLGMTSLPHSRKRLKQKIVDAEAAIDRFIYGENQKYLFVLEDLETKSVGGCCGIHSQVGATNKWCYQLTTINLPQLSPQTPATTKLLIPASYDAPASEICSLYILPEWRQKGTGKLLSLSRFLFMALFPERFQETIIAEMRGPISEDGISSVWKALGERIFNVPFITITTYLKEHYEIMPSLMLKHPLYVSLLPEEIQASIGTVHNSTKAALKMLLEQGFSILNLIDPIDGGPWVAAKRKDIKFIQKCGIASIANISTIPLQSPIGLIANGKIDFRACYGNWLADSNGKVTISKEIAEALQVDVGDTIAFSDGLQQG